MTDMEDQIGEFNFSLLQTFCIVDQGLKSFKVSENIFVLNLETSKLDDLIETLSDKKFKASLNEAVNIVMINIKIEEISEYDDLEYVRDTYFCDLLSEDRVMIVQICGDIWIKDKGRKGFGELKEFPLIESFIDGLEGNEKLINSMMKLSSAIKFILYNNELITSLIKLFKFSEQNEVDKKLFEEVAANNLFDTFQLMMKSHSEESKRNIYAFLREKGFKILEEVADKISESFRNKNSLIQFLMSRSRIAMCSAEDEEKYLKNIQQYYEYLNNFEDLQPIFKLVDTDLKIVFDFNSDSVERAYPLAGGKVKGIVVRKRMQIIVGAKNENFEEGKLNERDFEIAGTLIHELTHFAMLKVFKNNFKPYSSKDEHQEKEFKKYLSSYQRKKENFHDEIVWRVFNYRENVQPDELIVRAPQMIATYAQKETHLSEMKIKYKELFEYFNGFVTNSIKTFLDPESELKREVQELSNVDEKILEFYPETTEINFNQQKSIHLISSAFPDMALWQLMQQFDKNFTIFTSVGNLVKNEEKIFRTCQKSEKVKLVIKHENKEEISEDLVKSFQNFFIVCSNQEISEILKSLQKHKIDHEKISVKYKFCDLKKESKDKVLETLIKFQGKEFPMKNVFDENFEPLQDFPLEKLISHKMIEIGKEIERNEGYDENLFTKRTLSYEIEEEKKLEKESAKISLQDKEEKKKDLKEILTDDIEALRELMSQNKLLLLSDHAGQGKSTVLTHLAMELQSIDESSVDGGSLFDEEETPKLDWIVKINLHLYAELFGRSDMEMTDEEVINFVFENFVAKSKNDFELNLFKDFINQQKVILILDDFDEISPFCDENVKVFIKRLLKLKIKNIFVVTRPHLEKKFEEFGSKFMILKLLPFTRENQLNFITDFLLQDQKISKKILKDELEKLMDVHVSLLEQHLNENAEAASMLSTPLHTFMIANVIHQKIIENNYDLDASIKSEPIRSLYELYQTFMRDIKINTTTNKGKKVASELSLLEESNLIDDKIELKEACKKFAFQYIFKPESKEIKGLTKKEIDLMIRYGIVTVTNNGLHFLHQSYPEFFIAEEILEHILRASLLNSKYNENFLLLYIFTSPEYDSIREFIEAALSNIEIYTKASNEQNKKALGQFLISNFKSMSEIFHLKNILQLLIETQIQRIGVKQTRYYVFSSYLFLSSLLTCDNDDEVIKEMLWCTCNETEEFLPLIVQYDYHMQTDGNPQTIQTERKLDYMANEHVFHVACRLNIRCLILLVWEIACKVLDEEDLKKYFLAINSFNNNEKQFGVFSYCYEGTMKIMNLKYEMLHCTKLYSDFYKSYDDLLRTKRNEEIELNLDENFHFSTSYEIIEIAKSLNLTDREKFELTITDIRTHGANFEFYKKVIFFVLNVFLKIKKDLFNDNYHEKALDPLFYGDKIIEAILTGILFYTEEPDFIQRIFEFLKLKMNEEDYLYNVGHIFSLAIETIYDPYEGDGITEERANVMYEILKSTFKENLKNYFKFHYEFFFHNGNENRLKNGLKLYCKLLDVDCLREMMLNKVVDGIAVLTRLLFSSTDIAEFCLECLYNKFNSRKLLELLDASDIFPMLVRKDENFKVVIKFYEQNLSKEHLLKSLKSKETIFKAIHFSNDESFEILVNILTKNFNEVEWKKFFFDQLKDHKQTILHQLATTDVKKFEKLNELAIKNIKKFYIKLINDVKDVYGQSINDVKKKRNLIKK